MKLIFMAFIIIIINSMWIKIINKYYNLMVKIFFIWPPIYHIIIIIILLLKLSFRPLKGHVDEKKKNIFFKNAYELNKIQ